jgi:hypothetical protein
LAAATVRKARETRPAKLSTAIGRSSRCRRLEQDRDAAWTCRGKLSVKYVGRKKVNGTPLKRR